MFLLQKFNRFSLFGAKDVFVFGLDVNLDAKRKHQQSTINNRQ